MRAEHVAYALSFIVFMVNTLYVSYPDEFVNLLGGQSVLRGGIPYKDFFDHHMPFAWYASAAMLLFSFGSYVLFRLWWAGAAWATLWLVGRFIKSRSKELHGYYLWFIVVYPLVAMYYWLHLFLADSLGFLFISALLWLMLAQTFAAQRSHMKTLYLFSFLIFLLLFSSMTYILLAGMFYIWLLYLLYREQPKPMQYLRLCVACAAPYVVYALYLFISNSWQDFYIANVVYNTKLYISIPNYTKGNFFNPVKFALTVIYNFHQEYLPLLSMIKHIDLYSPMGPLFAFASFLLVAFAFYKNPVVGMVLFLLLSFSSPRSTISDLGETKYQAGGFISIGLVSAFFVLWARRQLEIKDELVAILAKVFLVVLLLETIFFSLVMAKYTYERWYLRYTQAMPGINDKSPTADVIDSVLRGRDAYYWVGPYEPHHQFFVTEARLPGRYVSLLPQFREDAYFSNGFIAQFETTKPEVIIFKHLASIFNTPSEVFGAFFLEWMNGRYVRMRDIPGIKIERSPETFEMANDVYLREDLRDELLQRFIQEGYVSISQQ